jgi:hypothetical protein
MTIQQIIDIPAGNTPGGERRLTIDVPREIPAGRAILAFTPAFSGRELDPRLRDAVDPAMYGKGEITGDIIGPFHDAWEQQEL